MEPFVFHSSCSLEKYFWKRTMGQWKVIFRKLQYILSMIFVCCGGFVNAQFYFNNCRSINCSEIPSKHFNVGSTLLLGWYDIATSITSNQRWSNVVYVNVKIYNVQQRWNNVVYFNVELNNVGQRQNNVVVFNVDFHSVGQRRNNVANMTISKKLSLDSKAK